MQSLGDYFRVQVIKRVKVGVLTAHDVLEF